MAKTQLKEDTNQDLYVEALDPTMPKNYDFTIPPHHELKARKRALDTQIGGNHYKRFKIQPIEFIDENNLSYVQGNIIEYVCRFEHKNGIEDLRKAKHYIDYLIEKLQKQGFDNGKM